MLDGSLLNFAFIPFETVLLLLLVGIETFNAKQFPMDDLGKVYVERAAVQGGFTSYDIEKLKMELGRIGFNPNKVNITITPEIAINVTSERYAKKGEIISIRMVNKDLGLFGKLLNRLGRKTDMKNICIRYSMSEKI